MQQLMRKLNISLPDLYVTSLIVCIGVAEVAHLAGLFLGLGMGTVGIIWAGGFSLLMVCLCIIWWKFRRKNTGMEPCCKGLPICFLLLVFVQLMYIFCMQQVVTLGDITLETVTTFLHEDGIHRVNPLTGEAYINPISMRYKMLCLSTLYASLCKLTGASPEVVVCHIIPLFVLAGCYFAYYKLAEQLFGKHTGKIYTFLIVVSLLLWVLNGAVYLDGYGIFYVGYSGTTIRGLILIPYTLQGGLEKQWWKCLLCILAELCICLTLWGLGFCLIITAVMVILHCCEAKKKAKEALA